MSSTKENKIKSQKIIDEIIYKIDLACMSLRLIKNDFRHGFHSELIFENNDYFLHIDFSFHPLDYPNAFNIKYLNKKETKDVNNKYQFLHELIEVEPMDLYLYSDKSVDNLIFYILKVDESKDKYFK